MKRKLPYVIAEIGGNFTSVQQAKVMIDQAAEAGVNAIKIQTFRAETLSSKIAMFEMENTGLTNQFDLFTQYEIDQESTTSIFQYAKKKNLDVFSTPSHSTDVDMLEEIGCQCYKIGSDDAVNIPFLRYVAKKGKPMILATGMCTMEEVHRSVSAILEEGNGELALLHAVTAYPTHPSDVNLGAMLAMKAAFPNLKIGYSDHTLGTEACIYAAALGAEIIEKHFTYDKTAEGADHMHSADKSEMAQIIQSLKEMSILYGSGVKMPAVGEKTSRKNNRKSLVLASDLPAGTVLKIQHIAIKRPGYGIQPCQYEQVLGRALKKEKKADEVLQWEDLC